MRRASALLALTEAERDSFSNFAPAVPVAVVPNGVEIPPARPAAAERIHASLGIEPTAPVVLFLGRLHPTKGADKLLAAFAKVAARVPDAFLVMAGPDEWGLQAYWRSQVPEDVQRRVLFPGMVVGDQKGDLLARADLFALPSIGEGFSMAVLEALASSTAVMLSPGCHFPEAQSAGAGVVVEAAPIDMAQSLAALLSDRQALQRMGAAGRRLVAASYSWDGIAERLAAVYSEGMDRHRHRFIQDGV